MAYNGKIERNWQYEEEGIGPLELGAIMLSTYGRAEYHYGDDEENPQYTGVISFAVGGPVGSAGIFGAIPYMMETMMLEEDGVYGVPVRCMAGSAIPPASPYAP